LQQRLESAFVVSGESNTYNSNLYGCALKAMVGDWRARWFAQNPTTNAVFPFGVVSVCLSSDNISHVKQVNLFQVKPILAILTSMAVL